MTTKALRKPRKKPLLVDRIITAFGETVTVGKATAEQFDEYIYATVGRLYDDKQFMQSVLEEKFNRDWRVLDDRIIALNQLHTLNRMRSRDERIALYADEVE